MLNPTWSFLPPDPERNKGAVSHTVRTVEPERVSVFIDGAHLFYAASTLNIETDFSKLLPSLVDKGRLVHAYYYSGCDSTNIKQSRFLQWMRHNGYRVLTQEVSSDSKGSWGVDFSVDISVDMIAHAQFCDTLLLVSGDGRFARMLEHVTYQGVKVEIIALRSMTSDSLLNVVDKYTDLADLKDEIKRSHISRHRTGVRAA